ncbi:MAG: STAS domain-containing protein [Spirochaetia bacterium]|nr:STAS domain-containing protein [Spirochaetia bacterium]
MEINFRDQGKHKIIEVSGDVDLYNVSELKQAIFDIVENSGTQSIIIDMKETSYLDSSGIGALVAGQKKIKLKGGKFALVNIKDEVLNVLKLATLDQFFTIYESEQNINSY